MRKLILLVLSVIALSNAGAQIGASYIRTPDSSLAITNNDFPDDTLFKFTKSGYIIKYESNVPSDTVVFTSTNSGDSTRVTYRADTFWIGNTYITTDGFGAMVLQGNANSYMTVGDQDGADGVFMLFKDRAIIQQLSGNPIYFWSDSTTFYGTDNSTTIKKGSIRSDTAKVEVFEFDGQVYNSTEDAKTYIEDENFDKLSWDTSLVNNDTITEVEFSRAVRKILYPNDYYSYLPDDSTYTTPSITAGVRTKIVVPTVDKYVKNWSVFDKGGSDFALRYDGADSSRFFITISTGMNTSASNVVFKAFLYKNGVIEPGVAIPRKIGTGADVGAITLVGKFDAATNDYFEVFIEVDGTTTVTFTYTSIVIEERGSIL